LNRLEMVYSIVHLIIKEAVPFDIALHTDLTKKNVLHWAVINKQRDLVDVLVGKLDADKHGLRNQADCKQQTPAQYDGQGSFSFRTIWDYARDGDLAKLKQCIQVGKYQANEQTQWLKNTPLHIALKNFQLEVVKCLIFDFAVEQLPNGQGKTPADIVKTLPLPRGTTTTLEAMRQHLLGLLAKVHSSTTLPTHTTKKQKRQEEITRRKEEYLRIKQELRERIAERGIDIEGFFKLFDKNGDGVFSQLEFECAFVALEIGVRRDDLRRFMALTDSNKDGKIDFKEFSAALNCQEMFNDDDYIEEMDLEASIENF